EDPGTRRRRAQGGPRPPRTAGDRLRRRAARPTGGNLIMVNVALTPRERALMLALMTLGGSASNPELDRRLGDTLDGAPRRRLNSSGLVTSEKQGRAYHHTLTEDGWAWCVAELSGTAPARGGASLARAL